MKRDLKMLSNTFPPLPMNRNEGNTPIFEPERQLYSYQNNYQGLIEPGKKPWPGEQPILWGLYSKYSKSGVKGCEMPPQPP